MEPRTLHRDDVDGPFGHLDDGSPAQADGNDDGGVGEFDTLVLVGQRRDVVDRSRDVLVIRPLGRLDAATIERVVQIVAESSTAVIVDLDECVLTDPEALAAIGDTVLGTVDVCIVCGRLSCRQLLARSGASTRFPVFQRQEDALQARLLAAGGYGRGWSVP